MLLILIIGAGSFFWFGIVNHPTPHQLVNVPNKKFLERVENKFGYSIWEPPELGVGVLSEVPLSNGGRLIFGCTRDASAERHGYVFCYDEDFNLLWKKKLSESLEYGAGPMADYFSISPKLIEDLNGDGRQEIVVVLEHNYFPRKLVVLSETGDEISHYYHAGSLRQVETAEIIPGNGVKELVIAGVNNEYKAGILAVLNPFLMQGQSPQTNPNYTNVNQPQGNEYLYIKFPTTDFVDDSNRDSARLLSNRKGKLRVGLFNYPRAGLSDLVFFYFGEGMHLESVAVSDAYYRMYPQVFPDKPALDYNSSSLNHYFTELEYWDGESWISNRTSRSEK